jgi:hypothetical protein
LIYTAKNKFIYLRKKLIEYSFVYIFFTNKLYESLAQLITENLSVQRWIFKLDDEHDGRGIAYCDTSKYLTCYAWALKEMNKFGDKWSKRWAYV